MVVPEERHLLLQRPARVQHAVEPPEPGGFDLLGVAEVGGERVEQLIRGRIIDLLGIEQSVERAVEAERHVLGELGFGRAEACSAQEVGDLRRGGVEGHGMSVS